MSTLVLALAQDISGRSDVSPLLLVFGSIYLKPHPNRYIFFPFVIQRLNKLSCFVENKCTVYIPYDR